MSTTRHRICFNSPLVPEGRRILQTAYVCASSPEEAWATFEALYPPRRFTPRYFGAA